MGWFYGEHHVGKQHWLDKGDVIDFWARATGAGNTGWIGAMGLIHGGTRRWLDRSDGFDLFGCALGAHNTGCIVAMGLIHEGVPWERATLAASGLWD